MTDPTKSDDNWAELYRELGVEDADSSPRAPEPRERPPIVEEEVVELTTAHAPDTDAEEEEAAPAIESEELGVIEGEFEPVEAEGEAEGETEAEGEPGKKRRRRRRRRKKKGGPNGQPEAAEAEGDAEEAEGAEGEPEEGEEAEESAAVGAEEEEVSPEVTRELIANWNVPSWQEIVAGLYRPDR
jgi:ribonuclease E